MRCTVLLPDWIHVSTFIRWHYVGYLVADVPVQYTDRAHHTKLWEKQESL